MIIHKVLITAAFAVVVPVGALAQSASESTKASHECGMMAGKRQGMLAGPAYDAAPVADVTPMACCEAKTAPVDHSAGTPTTTPPAPGRVVASHAAHIDGTAAGCCGDKMAAGEKMAARKEGCCAAMEGKECCAPKEGDKTAGCCAQAPRP
jgi:ABC-type Fe3+-hydroxamate transport system substrate-binding protein